MGIAASSNCRIAEFELEVMRTEQRTPRAFGHTGSFSTSGVGRCGCASSTAGALALDGQFIGQRRGGIAIELKACGRAAACVRKGRQRRPTPNCPQRPGATATRARALVPRMRTRRHWNSRRGIPLPHPSPRRSVTPKGVFFSKVARFALPQCRYPCLAAAL